MKTCSVCQIQKSPWDFSFSIKYSKYYDVCRECNRKNSPLREKEKLRKKVLPEINSCYFKGRIKNKEE